MSTDDDRHPFVSVNPRWMTGDPRLHGRRLRAELIADRYWHLGDQLETEILDVYEISRADVLVCCFYVATYGSRTRRRRWKAWLDQTWHLTGPDTGWWSDDWSDVPLPPHRKSKQEE